MEQFITIALVAIVLGLDAFSLAVGLGLKGSSRSYSFKFAGTVGVLHIFMPLLGLNLGFAAGNLLGKWASRLGALILFYIAFDFIIKGYRDSRLQKYSFKESKEGLRKENSSIKGDWKGILILGISVSVDALTVGFSLGTFKMPVVITAIIMGCVAFIMTSLGFWGGRAFNHLVGSYAQIFGGLILMALAVKLLF
ncbi:MAG: manganese efflux pump MntP family protein [Syntrophomonadaceae bacterium]|jgi:putative Mn2+ efflux pump MntP